MHFRDTDPRRRGCDSLILQRRAQKLTAALEYCIIHADPTAIPERPKRS
jgi:2C-methyl-D-erythritol 2,4-cyclodiphosphate synthase